MQTYILIAALCVHAIWAREIANSMKRGDGEEEEEAGEVSMRSSVDTLETAGMAFRRMMNNYIAKKEKAEAARKIQERKRVSKRTSQPSDADVELNMLEAHNDHRSAADPTAANMQQMVWNDELATIAKNYAQTCTWAHNADRSSSSSQFTYVGENKYLTTASTLDLKRPIDFWMLERSKYDFDTQTCSSGICTHYTQVMWHNSNNVGCGVHQCASMVGLSGWNNVWFVVCNYGPGGNYVGQDPYTQGESCSACCSENQCKDI